MLQALLSGILVGGIYGLFAMGFSLAFGVMRIVNFAHGELVMLGMYCGLAVFLTTHLDPLFAVPLAVMIIAGLGVLMYVMFYRRFVGKATLQQLLVAIALALILQSIAQILFSPDTRGVRSALGGKYVLIGSIFLSYAQIIAFGFALASAGLIELLLRKTIWGQSIRAVADDAEAAELVGINSNWVNLTAMALSAGLAGLAGAVLVTYFPVNPHVGFTLMPIALIATVLGGLGSVPGAFIGGILCGIIQQMTNIFWTPALQDVPLYVLLLAFLALRPYGLMGRKSAH